VGFSVKCAAGNSYVSCVALLSCELSSNSHPRCMRLAVPCRLGKDSVGKPDPEFVEFFVMEMSFEFERPLMVAQQLPMQVQGSSAPMLQ